MLTVLDKFTTDDVSLYWWYATKKEKSNVLAWEETGWHKSQVIIWVKNSPIFSRGQDYHRMYEPCMFGWKKGKKHYSDRKLATLRDVFTLEYQDFKEAWDNYMDVWYQKRDDTQSYVHPTQKPVKLAERGIKKNSKIGDVVVDAFLGSGSTLMACEQMGRKCYGMELDPKYVDVEVKRWEKFTGKKAKLIK